VRRQLLAQARDLVRRHRDAIERVVRELLERGTLTGSETDWLMGR
jgi:hypothetical protein